MNRSFRAGIALAALAFAGLVAPAANAQFSFTGGTEFFTIDPGGADFSGANGTYDAYYQVNGPAGAQSVTVPVFGDPTTFTADGTSNVAGGNLTVSNVSDDPIAVTGSATIAKDNNEGSFHYGYLTGNGDGILIGGPDLNGINHLLFDSSATDAYGLGLPDEIDIAILGQWSYSGPVTYSSDPGLSFLLTGSSFEPGSLDINSRYHIVQFYTDPNLGATFLTVAVPEPGNVALLSGLALSGLGFAAGRRRSRR
jgi:hypothetical protein